MRLALPCEVGITDGAFGLGECFKGIAQGGDVGFEGGALEGPEASAKGGHLGDDFFDDGGGADDIGLEVFRSAGAEFEEPSGDTAEFGGIDAGNTEACLLVGDDVGSELELCPAAGDAELRASPSSTVSARANRRSSEDVFSEAVSPEPTAWMPLMRALTSVPLLRSVETPLSSDHVEGGAVQGPDGDECIGAVFDAMNLRPTLA